MDTEILEDFGLSKGEIKVYLTLLEIGQTKVGAIIEKSKIASSAVHNSLNSLLEKGLISYIKKGKIKFYQAVPPNGLLDFLEEKKNKLKELLPEIESKQNLSQVKQEAEIFEGIKGITTMLNILIEGTKKGDEYLFFSVNIPEQNKEIQKFFINYDIKRKDKELNVKGLAPKNLKPLFTKRKFLKMKYTEFPIPSNISICSDKIAFFSWNDKPVGYLLKSKQISNIFKDYFKKIWKMKRLYS